ncbi:YqeG family HAD IIIA-type phosphatase [Bacillus sp. AFS077874]|uniref:YqeG family HAD IIIA-type phosphatase n=1 Tax=unclassified Bacillus (in: firmicutes) TaxID=185979 RepID=UPI000BEC0001|nr:MULTISPECIES: YqeG family HAD IIIA-type phosphatase [unclassified Bacillus (in: firmicutes)]PEC48517.1 YqeG family HAD IIIA-type phosphatase [Bacillus sp. AFS096315]PFM81053.1 YqeG family HAD IIIA-type phosphatase [Bacillus sp. AFS077874]
MFNKFLPSETVNNVYAITPEHLKGLGIKGIITDLDNTLVEWDRPLATPELTKWFKSMDDVGIKITVVSNNNAERVGKFCDPLGIPFIHRARKPLATSYKKAYKQMNLKPNEVVMIGDQLLTDVFGGNRQGIHTILVVPVASTDGIWTRFNRMVERRILSSLRKQGLLQWEDKK